MNDKNRVLFYRPGNKDYAIELEVFFGDDDHAGLLRWYTVIDVDQNSNQCSYRSKLNYEPWPYKFRWMTDWSRMKV